MASDDEVGESTCAHDLPVYWDERNEWGDCGICYPNVARWRAWQAFRDWLNGVDDGRMEQWLEVVRRHERMAMGL